MSEAFDYIIVGGGSAGCVLANRLSQDPATMVLLLEAGGNGRSLFVDMPTAFAIPMASKVFNWGYFSEPEPSLDGRPMDAARGRGRRQRGAGALPPGAAHAHHRKLGGHVHEGTRPRAFPQVSAHCPQSD